MSRKKTHEEYVAEVTAINPDIEVVDGYVNNKTNILHRCKIDEYEWMASPKNVLKGCGCPVCGTLSAAKKRAKTHERYVEEVAAINKDIEVVGKYINDSTKILHRCKIDGCKWCVKPTNILHGKGCPRCAGNERYGHEEYVRRVREINSNIEVIEKYVNAKTKILHRCKIDGYEWSANPSDILQGSGCPKCRTSIGEKTVAVWLNENGILYETQKVFNDCRDKYVLPFDFYLSHHNIAIEYNGMQHYEPVEYFGGKDKFEYIVRHDQIKENYCKENNIALIKIPYFADIYEELDKLFELISVEEVAA